MVANLSICPKPEKYILGKYTLANLMGSTTDSLSVLYFEPEGNPPEGIAGRILKSRLADRPGEGKSLKKPSLVGWSINCLCKICWERARVEKVVV